MTPRLHNYAEVRAEMEKEHLIASGVGAAQQSTRPLNGGRRKCWQFPWSTLACITTTTFTSARPGQSGSYRGSWPGGSAAALRCVTLLCFSRTPGCRAPDTSPTP